MERGCGAGCDCRKRLTSFITDVKTKMRETFQDGCRGRSNAIAVQSGKAMREAAGDRRARRARLPQVGNDAAICEPRVVFPRVRQGRGFCRRGGVRKQCPASSRSGKGCDIARDTLGVYQNSRKGSGAGRYCQPDLIGYFWAGQIFAPHTSNTLSP